MDEGQDIVIDNLQAVFHEKHFRALASEKRMLFYVFIPSALLYLVAICMYLYSLYMVTFKKADRDSLQSNSDAIHLLSSFSILIALPLGLYACVQYGEAYAYLLSESLKRNQTSTIPKDIINDVIYDLLSKLKMSMKTLPEKS